MVDHEHGARVLADYWSGHGHAGPSHGAERDAIAWGTPGDFDRCVALVTVHGKMTPEQARGYCNERHHDALGYWPAQHAEMERGKAMMTEELAGAEAAYQRVASLIKAAGGQSSAGAALARVQAALVKAGPTNPRDGASGKFRTFQGHVTEAGQAITEGRTDDAAALLAAARQNAPTDRHRVVLGNLAGAMGQVRHVEPDLTKSHYGAFTGAMSKVGPHGWSHGWIRDDGAGGAEHTTDDLPDTIQHGMINYQKVDKPGSPHHGSYRAYRAETGKPMRGMDAYNSGDNIMRHSRDTNLPITPIGHVKEPPHGIIYRNGAPVGVNPKPREAGQPMPDSEIDDEIARRDTGEGMSDADIDAEIERRGGR